MDGTTLAGNEALRFAGPGNGVRFETLRSGDLDSCRASGMPQAKANRTAAVPGEGNRLSADRGKCRRFRRRGFLNVQRSGRLRIRLKSRDVSHRGKLCLRESRACPNCAFDERGTGSVECPCAPRFDEPLSDRRSIAIHAVPAIRKSGSIPLMVAFPRTPEHARQIVGVVRALDGGHLPDALEQQFAAQILPGPDAALLLDK